MQHKIGICVCKGGLLADCDGGRVCELVRSPINRQEPRGFLSVYGGLNAFKHAPPTSSGAQNSNKNTDGRSSSFGEIERPSVRLGVHTPLN